MTLEEKVKVLDLLQEGMSYASVGKRYGVNESSVRTIKKNEAKIRQTFHVVTPSAGKYTSYVRDRKVAKMESALALWIQDQHRKGNPIDNSSIRSKAMSLYNKMQTTTEPDEPSTSTAPEPSTSAFTASKGWFENFKKRVGIHNVKITGEGRSADHAAATAFPSSFQKIIEARGYKPEQVFNVDETGLYWKKMPERTFIAKEEKKAPGFKAAKDRCTLILCCNAAGHMIKPGFIYKSQNPRALKHRSKNLLPVHWMSNKKAWTTTTIFLDWVHNCLLPEVRAYLEGLGIPKKILLVLDNAPSHPQSLEGLYNDELDVVFLPPNTTALLQPLDQGVIRAFKAYYTRLSMSRMHSTLDENPDLGVKEYWKSFTIADCLTIVEGATKEVKHQTVNSCWKILWPSCVHSFTGFSADEQVEDQVKKTVALAKEVGGEGFADMEEEEVRELVRGHAVELSEEELVELVQSASEEDEEEKGNVEEESQPQEGLTLDSLAALIRQASALKAAIYETDTSMVRAIAAQNGIDSVMAPYKAVLQDMKKRRVQLPITMFLQKRGGPANSDAESD